MYGNSGFNDNLSISYCIHSSVISRKTMVEPHTKLVATRVDGSDDDSGRVFYPGETHWKPSRCSATSAHSHTSVVNQLFSEPSERGSIVPQGYRLRSGCGKIKRNIFISEGSRLLLALSLICSEQEIRYPFGASYIHTKVPEGRLLFPVSAKANIESSCSVRLPESSDCLVYVRHARQRHSSYDFPLCLHVRTQTQPKARRCVDR